MTTTISSSVVTRDEGSFVGTRYLKAIVLSADCVHSLKYEDWYPKSRSGSVIFSSYFMFAFLIFKMSAASQGMVDEHRVHVRCLL